MLGSIAAIIQSRIGNVPQGSLFSYLQKFGAGGFAKEAITLGGRFILIAVVLATVGKILLDQGVTPEKVMALLEKAWSKAIEHPHTIGC